MRSHRGRAATATQYDESPILVMPIISQMLSDSLPKPADVVPVWTRRTQVKQWPLSRALRCGMELAEALHYCRAPPPPPQPPCRRVASLASARVLRAGRAPVPHSASPRARAHHCPLGAHAA
eukprot:6789297-Prymnesium_polylepis.1